MNEKIIAEIKEHMNWLEKKYLRPMTHDQLVRTEGELSGLRVALLIVETTEADSKISTKVCDNGLYKNSTIDNQPCFLGATVQSGSKLKF